MTRSGLRAVVLLAVGLVAHPATAGQADPPLPMSSLAVRAGDRWVVWWRSDAAPTTWSAADPVLVRGLRMRRSAPGLEWGEVRMAGSAEAWRLRLIAVRLDPREVRFRLDTAYTEDRSAPAWTLDRVPASALFAVNAGQFPRTMPWGWVVLNGREYLSPRTGPLSTGIGFAGDGEVRWIDGGRMGDRGVREGVEWGFQSYPTLLRDGTVPVELQGTGRGVDLAHRDARLAIGQDAGGRILVVLTRFDGAGGLLDFLPFGLTVPEMAAVMGGLGARHAVMLDGGISSQMLIRSGRVTRRWQGLRRVPLALVAEARKERNGPDQMVVRGERIQ